MIKPNFKVIGICFGINGILALCSFAPTSYAKDKKPDSELRQAAEQAVKFNREVDEGLNPACPKCEAIAGNLPQVHKTIPLFQDSKPISLEITTDFNRLAQVPRFDKTTKVPGSLRYFDAQGASHDLPMQVEIRGNLKQILCSSFRPLRVVFDKNQDLSDTPFKGISEDFKIATHCNGKGKIDDSTSEVQQVLKEYTAYKALEALGFMSLKVRLAQIKYKSPNGETYAEAKAFLLEPKSNMAKRFGKKQINQNKAGEAQPLNESQLLPYEFSNQFLTHSDTLNDGSHNGILVADKGSRKPDSIVPYDFDNLGMIHGNGHQYEPDADAQWLQEKIRKSANPKEVVNVARFALAHKDAVMKVIADSPAQDVSEMKKRAEAFFGGIESVLKEPLSKRPE
jgi:hypothetical protein